MRVCVRVCACVVGALLACAPTLPCVPRRPRTCSYFCMCTALGTASCSRRISLRPRQAALGCKERRGVLGHSCAPVNGCHAAPPGLKALSSKLHTLNLMPTLHAAHPMRLRCPARTCPWGKTR